MGVTQSAGLSLRWFRDHFGVAADAKVSLQNNSGRDPYDILADEASARPRRLRRRFLGALSHGRTHPSSRSPTPVPR